MDDEKASPQHPVVEQEAQFSWSALRSLPFGDFGTEALCQGTFRLLAILEGFATTEVSRPQTETFELLGQVKILYAVSHELSIGALHQNRGQTSDPTQDQLWGAVNIVSQRCCNDTIGPLHDGLEEIKGLHDRGAAICQLLLPQEELQQYRDALQALKYQTAVFSVLQTAIRL